MVEAGVDLSLIRSAIEGHSFNRVLPFRFLKADEHAPSLGDALESAMLRGASSFPKLDGTTALLIDTSGSMTSAISGKSELSRLEAAAALAILAREVCASCRIFWFHSNSSWWGRSNENWFGEFSSSVRGFALRTAVLGAPSGGTDLGGAIAKVPKCDRLIVFTDEQSHSSVGERPDIPLRYIANVASYHNGVGYGHFTHIHGFSEQLIPWITTVED